ncbi:MAG: glycerate kinase [Bacilli bacterium]|jgi:glycerate kinase
MKIVIASDSFKGTLSSLDICHLFEDEMTKYPLLKGIYLPIADGGEGSLDAISYSIKGHYVPIVVKDPYFAEIPTKYYIDIDNNAYIETASCAGLCLIRDLNPMNTTTYGLGQQVLDALKKGCKKIYIFLGGSATNDGGCGLFSALGTKFTNRRGEVFIPTGGTLKDIVSIDNSLTLALLKAVQIIGLCDVKNHLYGKSGAAYVYAPQKGADEKMVKSLDEGLRTLARAIKKDLHKDIASVDSSGAAGGLGAGILAFGNGDLKSGIDTVLNLLNFAKVIRDADFIISGEGKLDKQSFNGKVIQGIASRCQKENKRLLLIVGESEVSLGEAKKKYSCIEQIFETNMNHLPFKKIQHSASAMYQEAVHRLLSTIVNQ